MGSLRRVDALLAPAAQPADDPGTSGRVTSVCVVHELLPEPTNPDGVTAIDKRAVPGSLRVGELGLDGDRQADARHHGGPDKALYAYADEDADLWAQDLGREVPAGMFGENLRTSGVDVSGARIGQRWSIGDSGLLVEVTGPRTPCATFARRMGEPRWVSRFTERRAPGAYLRIVQPGTVAAGDRVVAHEPPAHDVTIADVFAPARPGAMARLLEAERAGAVRLGPSMRATAIRAVG